MQADLGIVGGGIIGLATAHRFVERYPGRTLLLLEKESTLGQHQSGHNSGVLHSGIYYRPDSLKAANCRAGKEAMQAFCAAEGIPFEICGKVIVAVSEAELENLAAIEERGRQNGVPCERIGRERLRELEPHAAGIAALHVPETGIVDFGAVCQRLAVRIQEAGAQILLGERVNEIELRQGRVRLETEDGEHWVKQVVTCGGLHADRLARKSGARPETHIIPFRGEYYELRPEARGLCRNLIYPVPDPKLPFLGVHFTRMMSGGVECGPNAVLAGAREGYHQSDVSLTDLAEVLAFPGFYRLAQRFWRIGLTELWRSLSKAAFVRNLQRLLPDLEAEHLQVAPAGVRAQAVSPDGHLADDFIIHETERAIHVLNAPSPAATSSLNIGNLVVNKLAPRLG